MKKLKILLILLILLLSNLCWSSSGWIMEPRLGYQIDTAHPLGTKGGLVGCWPFNEGSGGQVFDLSGNGNTGTFTNVGIAWTTGKYGSAVLFGGTTDYINVVNSNSFISKRTIVVWFRPVGGYSSGSGTETLYDHRINGGTYAGSGMTLKDNDGKLRAFNYIDATQVNADSTITSWDDRVYMAAVTADGTNLTLYIDGIYNISSALTTAFADSTNVLKWGANWAGINDFNGIIELAMVYNRALTASEIALLYREPFCMFEPSWNYMLYGAIGAPPPTSIPIFMYHYMNH